MAINFAQSGEWGRVPNTLKVGLFGQWTTTDRPDVAWSLLDEWTFSSGGDLRGFLQQRQLVFLLNSACQVKETVRVIA